jgi:hypothetical protein
MAFARIERMHKRWLLGAGILVVAIGAWYLLHDNTKADAMTPQKGRDAKVAIDKPRPVEEDHVASLDKPPCVSNDPLRPCEPVLHAPKVDCNADHTVCHREIVDAVPDEELRQKEEMKYKIQRLRLSASDAAAPCYTGGDSRESMDITYTVVIDKEQLHAENVRVSDNTISDPAVTACILSTVRDMSTLAEQMPDMRVDEHLTMDLHSLWVRNQGAAAQERNAHTVVDPQPTPTDRPPAQIPDNR